MPGIDPYLEEIRENFLKEYLKEIIHPILPNQLWAGVSSSGPVSNPNMILIPRLSSRNLYFKNSDYYFEEEPLFIHYTSLQNILNILNEGSIRLFDFNYFDDPQEFLVVAQRLGLKGFRDDYKDLRALIFAISMCKFNNDNNRDKFEMWRLYGNDGNGVGLVFSFDNNIEDWENFHLSKVYYEKEKLDVFKELNKKHLELTEKYPISIHHHYRDYEGKKIPIEVSILAGFHKNYIYKIEDEVRLIGHFPIMPHSREFEIFYTLNKSKLPSSYIKLPFDNNGNSNASIPKIKIEKIILGYRYSYDDLEQIKEIFNKIAIFKYAMHFEIEISQLKNYF